jgi:hypothetical protein
VARISVKPGVKTHGEIDTNYSDRQRGVLLAVRLGLLWQAAFSVAMLGHYARHGSSMYLPQIASAWPYVHQHLLWIATFLAMVLRRRALATVLGVAAAFLAVVQVVTLAHAGGRITEVLTAIGVGSIGFVPVAVLLVLGQRVELERRLDWLVCFIAVGAMLAALPDGIDATQGGGMRVTSPRSAGVLTALRWSWIVSILLFAWRGWRSRIARLGALLTTGHLLLIEGLWLAAEVALRREFGLPGIAHPAPLGAGLAVLIVSLVLLAQLMATLVSENHTGQPPGTGFGRGGRWRLR